jgi:hypothetical protein
MEVKYIYNYKKNGRFCPIYIFTVKFGYKDIVYIDKTTEIWPFLLSSAIFRFLVKFFLYGQNDTFSHGQNDKFACPYSQVWQYKPGKTYIFISSDFFIFPKFILASFFQRNHFCDLVARVFLRDG